MHVNMQTPVQEIASVTSSIARSTAFAYFGSPETWLTYLAAELARTRAFYLRPFHRELLRRAGQPVNG